MGAVGIFFAIGCSESVPHQSVDEAKLKEQLLRYNKARVNEEDRVIDRFIAYHGLNFTTSETGLRYEILSDQRGSPLRQGDYVSMHYTIHLLDSTLCYDNRDEAPLGFTVNGSDVASGFHELAMLIGRGASARSIWPARLGYGVAGDLSCIPLEAVLLVQVSIE
jgi:FKBP-type peptidyl-prolyl cis-trans isomerase